MAHLQTITLHRHHRAVNGLTASASGGSLIRNPGGPDHGGTGMDGPGGQRALGEVIALLRQVIGDDRHWADRVTTAARLDQDRRMDGLEMAARAPAMGEAYGDRVDLAAFVAGLDF